MLVKIITVPFNTELNEFDESKVSAFLKNKDISSISEHFFIKDELPHLSFVVKYSGGVVEEEAKVTSKAKKIDESWKKGLSDSDMELFNKFREWRSHRCKLEGVPPYILFTNSQLAQITKLRPSSLTVFEKIPGVGKSRIEKYGRELIEITKEINKDESQN